MCDFQSCLTAEAENLGLADDKVATILTMLPGNLKKAGCFFDTITGLWRYEYGLPSTLNKTKKYLSGTHMCPPMKVLIETSSCAHDRLSREQLSLYMQRLDNLDKHRDVLAEMMPLLRADNLLLAEFEVSGYGQGNKTIDWKIEAGAGRLILIDVKNRMTDLYTMMDQEGRLEPNHDYSLLVTAPPPTVRDRRREPFEWQ